MNEKIPIRNIYFKRKILPIEIFHNVLDKSYKLSRDLNSPVLSVVIGTKPDFYKQAPVMIEAIHQKLPAFVIDTGQHFDDLLGFGIQEFELQDHIACNLQIRGDLMEKASELILKFGSFGSSILACPAFSEYCETPNASPNASLAFSPTGRRYE